MGLTLGGVTLPPPMYLGLEEAAAICCWRELCFGETEYLGEVVGVILPWLGVDPGVVEGEEPLASFGI